MSVEWRVYLNVAPCHAPAVLDKALSLFKQPDCHVLQIKINASLEEAKKRSDVIVVYTDSEVCARLSASAQTRWCSRRACCSGWARSST